MHGSGIIDRIATRALMDGKVPKRMDGKVPKRLKVDGGYQKNVLLRVLTGASRPLRRLWHAGKWHGPTCPRCGKGCPEDKVHVFWECPRWEKRRSSARVFLDQWGVTSGWVGNQWQPVPGAATPAPLSHLTANRQ